MFVQALAGDEGAQVVHRPVAFEVRAPTEKRVKGHNQERREQQAIDRTLFKHKAGAHDRAVPNGQNDRAAPVPEKATPGQRPAGEDLVGDDGLSQQQHGEADQRGDGEIEPGDDQG